MRVQHPGRAACPRRLPLRDDRRIPDDGQPVRCWACLLAYGDRRHRSDDGHLTGGIDLSVGSVLALAGLSTGMLLERGVPLPVAMLAGLGVGTLVGLVNGLLITRGGLPPFIAALGTLSIGRGFVYVLTKGYPVTAPYDYQEFIWLGQGYIWIILVAAVMMVMLTLLGTIFLGFTTYGRYIYAVAGNPEAARLAGIPVERVKLLVYVLCSTLAALAGLILVARLVSAQPSAGLGFELPVIAAAIIGGTSLMGGGEQYWVRCSVRRSWVCLRTGWCS